MEKLTSERVNGIKQGYWSPASKETVVQKLGAIEHKSEDLIGQICDHWCQRDLSKINEDGTPAICDRCPVSKLAELIGV